MTRLAIPVIGRTLYATGDVTLRADVTLALRDAAGYFVRWLFRIDSATDVTTFPAFEARRFGLPLPGNPSPIRHDPTGLEVRSGLLRIQIDGLDQTEYVVSCFFLGNPGVALNPAVPAFFSRAFLQPLALLDRLKITMEKDAASIGASYALISYGCRRITVMEKDAASIGASYGEVIIEKK